MMSMSRRSASILFSSIVLLHIPILINICDAFQINNPSNSIQVIAPTMRESALKMTNADTGTDKKDSSTKTASLVFLGEIKYQSEPISSSSLPDGKNWDEFLGATSRRNCLVTAGNSRDEPTVVSSPSSQLISLWKSKAVQLGANEPDDQVDSILKVKTGGIRFPGLTLTSNALIGCKFLPAEKDEYPSYEFLLITDEQSVEGSKPILWIYNTLMGGNKKKKQDADGPQSLSRFTISKLSSSDDDVVFESDVMLRVEVKFPSFLLKIIPGGKTKAEEQGSKAISKTVGEDVKKSVNVLRDQYMEWIQK